MSAEPLLPGLNPPQPQRTSKLLTVCPFILGNEFCERLAFYGLATNMSIYLTTVMGLKTGEASIQVSLFEGTCYMTPLIGAWLADSYWGRYKTILVFSVIYAAGMFLMASTALVPGLSPKPGEVSTNLQLALFYIALYIVSLGTGGIKPNVSAFGADQFDDKNRQDRKDKQSFFNWFYFSINIGSLIACTVIVWIQGKDWGTGFAIPAVAMALAVVLFVAGHSRYSHQDPTGSPISRVLSLASAAFRRRVMTLFCRDDEAPSSAEGDEGTASLFQHALRQAQHEGAAGDAEATPNDALAWAGRHMGYSEQQVEEVRLVTRMTPIFLLTILYWTVYTQMSSVFVIQGKHMDCEIAWTGGSFDIPPASLTMFNTVAIVVLIPIYDGIFNPLMKRLGCGFTMLQRMGWGFLAAALAMAAAAMVERRRTAALAAGGSISVLEQATQYLLVGVSEVLASIGQMEFFYDQAPDVMRSCCMALQLLSTALGGYLSALVMYVVDNRTTWLADLDHGSRLDLYFMLLAGIMLANTVVFVFVAMGYRYKEVKHRSPVPLIGGQQDRRYLNAPRVVTGVQARGGSPPTTAIDIGSRNVGYGYQFSESVGTPDVGPYGRSITYAGTTPLMPPNFR